MSYIEKQQEYIRITRDIIKEFGIEGECRLESIVPYKVDGEDMGYDVGVSIVVSKDIFGDEKRETYYVRLDGDKNFVKFWRKNGV